MRPADKEFLFWDGEGITYQEGEPQEYVLFSHHLDLEPLKGRRLRTWQCLDKIIEQGKLYNDTHIHVAFAFDYDVNMILRDLTRDEFARLAETGSLYWGGYRIEHLPGKWLRVTEKSTKTSVLIQDMFSFFQVSFLKALKNYLPELASTPEFQTIMEGKGDRGTFTYDQMDMIERYWRTEGDYGYQLANSLRDTLYAAGFFVTKWHGPGALANYLYTDVGMLEHKEPEPEPVYDRARLGYAGGRFELFQMGRHLDCYSYDINSAYPYAITQLPSLSEGVWVQRDRPDRVSQFGIYHFLLLDDRIVEPGIAPFRDSKGGITFTNFGEVWLWSPEAHNVFQYMDPSKYVCLDSWDYVNSHTKPFGFVADMYALRREHKARGEGVEKAYKLALNSLYGKMAQRAGWERSGGAPKWHQLSWAGWVTSNTRAMLYRLMRQMDPSQLIAVETDGLYCTASPDQLGIENSKELGGWEVEHYDEMLYLQSGVYAKRNGTDWSFKFRGLDGKTLNEHTMRAVLEGCGNGEWPTIKGNTTRFIGYKAALMRSQDENDFLRALKHHRVWETKEKELSLGIGKRFHLPANCPACAAGHNAYEQPHQLTISPMPFRDLTSHPHDIPWLGDIAEWRKRESLESSMLFDQTGTLE